MTKDEFVSFGKHQLKRDFGKMGRYFPVRIIMMLCLCSAFVTCSDNDSNSPSVPDVDPIQNTEAIWKMVGRLEVRVDPRIELINVVENAKSFEEKYLREPTMRQETANHFFPYKDHPAVEMMQKLKAMGFTYTKPRFFALGCSNPPELRQLYPLKQIYPYNGLVPNDETLAEFILELQDFYNDSKFGTFYYKHQSDYIRLLDVVSEGFEKMDYIELLEDYFGMRKDEYVLIYSPTRGGFGVWIKTKEKTTIYSIMSHGDVPLNLHEFAHSFVNPITDVFRDEINKYYNLFYAIQQDLPSYYDDWWIAVNEHIIRAFTARIQAIVNGETVGEQAIQREVSDGFGYIIPIYNLLKEYEANRDKYPNFYSFYPRIIELFDELSRKLEDAN